jgi:tRNA (Thr-GGU) A37 N-methylase
MSEDSGAAGLPTVRPIGVIHSPHTRSEETPIQPVFAQGVQGRAEILAM